MATKKKHTGSGKTKKRSTSRARDAEEVIIEETTQVERPRPIVQRREPVTLARALGERVVAEPATEPPRVTKTTVRKRRRKAA